jgi:hypothetical protein
MHLTTMQLILVQRVDIQHFNVSSCQQLASSILCTHYYVQLILVQRVDNIQHVSSANNRLSILCTLTTMQIDLWSKEWIFNTRVSQQLASSILCNHHYKNWPLVQREWIFKYLMCPLANNWPPGHFMHLTTMQLDLWSKEWIFNINVSSCQQLASQYYAPTNATDLGPKSGYSTF